ncbi:MAG: hypothetical protein ACRCZF_06870 [Gemmataceae bacterium]
MSTEIQWTDTDPETGDRRWLCAEKFAREWHFKVRRKRRDIWRREATVSRAMWEALEEALLRRHQRGEKDTDLDLAYVRAKVAAIIRREAKIAAEEAADESPTPRST